MSETEAKDIDVVRLTNGEGHFFFGYYDVLAMSRDGKHHLAHKVDFWDRLPTRDDKAQVGIISMQDKGFTPLAETPAWNFQQGAMLQWNPARPDDEIVFNTWDADDYRGVVMNIHTGKQRTLDCPIANLASDGKHGLSINFDRMFDFRPGYGYAVRKDPFSGREHPAEDGVRLVDMRTGHSELILSLDDLWRASHDKGLPKGNQKLVINHLSFNPDGSRFVLLARYFPPKGEYSKTLVATAGRHGENLACLTDYTYASHYHWRDPSHLMIHSEPGKPKNLYLLTDPSGASELVHERYFEPDGHCSYSPDREWILCDNYLHDLFIYNIRARHKISLGKYPVLPTWDPFKFTADVRCDLHPRWNPAGNAVTFDSIHESHRHIYSIDLAGVMEREGSAGSTSRRTW